MKNSNVTLESTWQKKFRDRALYSASPCAKNKGLNLHSRSHVSEVYAKSRRRAFEHKRKEKDRLIGTQNMKMIEKTTEIQLEERQNLYKNSFYNNYTRNHLTTGLGKDSKSRSRQKCSNLQENCQPDTCYQQQAFEDGNKAKKQPNIFISKNSSLEH